MWGCPTPFACPCTPQPCWGPSPGWLQFTPGSKERPRGLLLPWCRCCTWRQGRWCGGTGLPLHTLCRNWKQTQQWALTTGVRVLSTLSSPPAQPLLPPAVPGSPPGPPCFSTPGHQSLPEQAQRGVQGPPICRIPSSCLAPSSSCGAQKLGCVGSGSAGGETGLPPLGTMPTVRWCLPVAVRCCCCRGLGVSVGGIAPLQQRERLPSGRGAAPARGGSGGPGQLGTPWALPQSSSGTPQGAGARATRHTAASLLFPRGFHKH